MSYVHATIPMDANKIARMMQNGLITNDASHQRASLDWNKETKTGAITSGILDIPFPPLYAKREKIEGKNYYRMIDGGHRSETYRSYINNEWATSKCDPITFFNDVTGEFETVDVSYKVFSELPISVREKILNTNFQMVFFDNLTKEEEVELFRRLNSGKPLSSKEKVVANTKDIDTVLEIGAHPIFNEIYSKVAVRKKSYVSVIMKIWCMTAMKAGDISFDTKTFSDILKDTIIVPQKREEIERILSAIMDIHKELMLTGNTDVAKKIYTETHLVSISPFVKNAIDSGKSSSDIARWIISFYKTDDGASNSSRYNNACRSGVAKGINILARHSALEESYEEFFK